MIREHKVQKSEEKRSEEKSPVQKSPGQVRSENLREGLGGMSFPAQKAVLDPNVLSTDPVQRKKDGESSSNVQSVASWGVRGAGTTLPHADAIQKSFGSHDVSGVRAHVGGQAESAAQEIGAKAYATGNNVAFSGSPDLHTAAHEAAHVVQQKAGVSLKGGVGEVGDRYEQHADAVADAVVQGKSAESLLSKMAGSGGGAGVQMKKEGAEKEPFDQWNLSADVKALFVELGKAKTDKDREGIVNKLHTNHRVPKTVIANVVAGEKGVFGDLWKNIKGGSWSQANVDESGAITSTFKLDKKGIGWETATYGVTVNDKGEATYTDKDDHWKLEANKDGATYTDTNDNWSLAAERAKNHGLEGGEVTYSSGTKETGTTEIKARGGGGGGTGYGGGTYTTAKGDDKTSVSADVLGGNKTGVIGSATVNNKDRDTSGSADVVRTEGDSSTSTTVGASATTTDKSKETPITVNASGRVTQNENNNGDESTKIEVGGGYKEGTANISGNYANTRGSVGGNAYTINELSFSMGDSYSLGNPELNKDLSLKLTGGLRLTNELEKENTFNTTLSGVLTEGKGDDKETLNFSIFGGKATAGDIAGKTNLNDDLIGGDKTYGYFGGGSLSYSSGLDSYSGSLTGGATDTTTMLGLNAGYSHLNDDKKTKDVELNLYAGLALKDDNYAALIRTNNKFALNKDFNLGIGGKIVLQPRDNGHDEIWSAYSSLGYNLDKDKTLTLTMGVADNGEQISYIPGIMFTQDKKHTAELMASIPQSGGSNTYGAKYTHEKSGLSVFGGYGDMNAMSNPYYGSPGVGMPMTGDDVLSHRDGEVFIGVQVDAIKLFKKVFGD